MNQPKQFYLSTWFPAPISWLKALIIATLMTIFVVIIKNLELKYFVFDQLGYSLELLICFSIIILLLLIPFMAFGYHFIQLLLDFWQQIFSKKSQDNFFLFPEVSIWWQALYSWLVIIISTLAAILIYTLILPWFNLSYKAVIFDENHFISPQTFPEKLLLFVFISVWIIVAAKLYQFEFSYQTNSQSLLDSYQSQTSESTVSKSPIVTIKQVQIQKDDSQTIQRLVRGNETDNDLAKYSSYYRVNQIAKARFNSTYTYRGKKNSYNQGYNQLKKIPKAVKTKILIFLIMALVALGMYGFSRWQLVAETPVVVVTDIPLPIANEVNSEDLEVEEITTQSTPKSYSRLAASAVSSETIVLPPPDPFKLAVNRAMNAAEMAQSAQSKIEWEGVASQWQDATELMKIVPASHPKYVLARTKIREYQSYSDYAMRVAELSDK